MSHDSGPGRRHDGLNLYSALSLQVALPTTLGDNLTSAASELNLFLASAILALIVSLITSALQIAGVISMYVARWLLVVAWLVGVAGSATSLNNAPLNHRIITAALVGLPFGLTLFLLERWIVRKTRKPVSPPAVSSTEAGGKLIEKKEPKPLPNLVCGIIDHLPAHEEYGILVEGHAEGDSDAFVYGVKIGNEFSPARKVGGLSDVSAQVFYTSPDSQTLKVLRGTWLSEGRYQVDFNVNNEHSLIIAGMPRSITQGAQLAFYLRREASNSDRGIEDRIGALSDDSYQVKIRLVTESEGIVHGEFDYRLTITREPVFRIKLIEDKQQPTPPSTQEAASGATHATQATTAGNREAVVRRLRGFQTEGRRLLETSVNNTLFRVSDFHHWEEEVETFIRENIGDAQANEFITDDPIIPYRNLYSLLNTAQTNLINTRLDRLSNLISRIQRS